MKVDYISFKEELKVNIEAIYNDFIRQYNPEDICGFAICTDASAMNLSVSVNTFTHLNEQDKNDPGYREYYRFAPAEWAHEMYGVRKLYHINKLLIGAKADTDEEFQEHCDRIYFIAVEVLEELKNEGLFSGLSPEFVLMLAFNDFEDLDLEASVFRRLNPAEVAQKFERCLEEEI